MYKVYEVCMYLCMLIDGYVCKKVCIRYIVCIYVCMYICIYLCTSTDCSHTYIHTYIHTHTVIHTRPVCNLWWHTIWDSWCMWCCLLGRLRSLHPTLWLIRNILYKQLLLFYNACMYVLTVCSICNVCMHVCMYVCVYFNEWSSNSMYVCMYVNV